MWKPKYVRCCNLFSHKDTTFNFIDGKMIMLLGEKNDDKKKSNGGGKSTIIEAITLAITGEVYRGVGKESFIKNLPTQQPFTSVEMELENILLNQILTIKRKIYINSKSSTLDVLINGEKPKTVPTATSGGVDVKIGNKEIFNIIGISKEDFLNYYVIGQGNNNSFFTSNDTKQKEIISRFSNFTQIDALLLDLELKEKSYSQEIQEINSRFESNAELLNYIQDQINEINHNFKQDKLNNLNAIKELINSNQKRLDISKAKLVDIIALMSNKQAELNKIKLTNTELIELEIQDARELLADTRTEYNEASKYLTSLNKNSGEVIECPQCLSKFIPESNLSVEDLTENIKLTTLLTKELETKITAVEVSLNNLKKLLLINDELNSKRRVLANEISSHQSKQSELKEDIDEIEQFIKIKNKDLIDELKKHPIDKINKLKDRQKTESDINKKLSVNLKKIEEKRAENNFHLFHFGKKGFKTFLANKSIRTIQDMCNYYLQKFNTDLQVLISGYKLLKSGEVRDKIEISIMQAGVNKGSFNGYSGGEKSRVSICGIISINKLINNTSLTGGLDLLCLDENISYLDASGQEEVINILSKARITSILVMHNISDMPYKYKIIISKTDQDSKILH